MNTAKKILESGQSIWYDNIERRLLKNGEMAGMIERGEIRGVTSNPSIFMKAITKSTDYDLSLAKLRGSSLDAEEVFFVLAIEDIQEACDMFRGIFDESGGDDGFISLEVSPFIAHDTEKTLEQAKDLWARVDRPNLLVKIPATKASLVAVEEAIFAGINVNITLVFSLDRYRDVMEAYLRGLERRVEAGLPVDSIVSVASFFISRIDVKVNKHLQKIVDAGGEHAEKANALKGKAAIANARLAYEAFKSVFSSERFLKLKVKGARIQKPLWASTSTKDPSYSDVLYVEELIGQDTINTVPPKTLEAFLDHGVVESTIEKDLDGARQCFEELEALDISMDEVTSELLDEGVKAFADAFTLLLEAIDQRLTE